MSYTLIDRRELTSNASSISFENIPQNYIDLVILFSTRSTRDNPFITWNGGNLTFNNSSTGYSTRMVEGNGSSAYSQVNGVTSYFEYAIASPDSATTANTFSNGQIYISNYTSSSAKAISGDRVTENNATQASQLLVAGLWNNTAAITTITITESDLQFAQGSSVSLYGVGLKQGPGITPKALGGWVSQANGYWCHSFTSSGSFIPLTNLNVEYLVIAGGGGGGFSSGTENGGGAGGAGGYRSSVVGELSGGGNLAESMLSLNANQNYPIVVGAGGAPQASGTNSTFSSITSTGGGRGATNGFAGNSGGSGGGGGAAGGSDFFGGSGTSSQGYRGGYGGSDQVTYRQGGGGGGAGGPGEHHTNASNRSSGGRGLPSSITGTVVRRAGGGSIYTASSIDGGGVFGIAAVANTGGGGQGQGNPPGGANGGAGASGVVIIRYKI
jgi:hypothetical protein